MNRSEKFFLIVLMIFAMLFLTTLYMYKVQRSQLARMNMIVRAYELFTMGKYDEFSTLVESHQLHELRYLESNLKKRKFQELYSLGVSEFNLGNYAQAAEFFKQAAVQLEATDPKFAETVYLLSLSLIEANRTNEARLFLEQHTDLPDSPYKRKIIETLADIYKKQGEHDKAENILKGVKK